MNATASLLMLPLRAAFSAAVRARLAAYRHGLFSISKLAAPVISVGNLTTGGTGKTPLVEWVCRKIAGESGFSKQRLCVLTRGYGRTNPETQVVVSNGEKLLAGAREAGDEPFLLAENLLGVAAVISNPNRTAAGEWAIQTLDAKAFVLDDGFQHLRLARDLDVVTVDATNPWGGGGLLPAGILREPAAGVSRADCVVISRIEQTEDPASIIKQVQELAGDCPVFASRMVTAGIKTIDGDDLNQGHMRTQPVGAFCGIGNSASFFTHLQREGWNIVFTRKFADHHRYRQSELNDLVAAAKAAGATMLITTAKDGVKLRSLRLEMSCCVLQIRVAIEQEDRLIQMIRQAVAASSRQ